MAYIPHTDRDISEILKSAGVESIEDLLAAVPEGLRAKEPLGLPAGLSEQALKRAVEALASKNSAVAGPASFLGAGAYSHYTPSLVASLAGRSEFYTSYTPYQPEISQGTLQAIFEYQTLVCQLTGMDVSNASLYDGGTACAEAALMAMRITGRKKVILSAALHPEYRETVKTYLKFRGAEAAEALYCTEEGRTLPGAVEAVCNEDPACLIVQNPNFFGCIEDVEALSALMRGKGGLLVAAVSEPVSLGMLKPPGELGADIAVGENQSFGMALSLGGPYLGFMATKEKYVRQMPGRLVGQTIDNKGRRAFCLTFAAREQHIRREKAASNICTNHGLSALTAAIHMTSLGRTGLKKLAGLNLSKAAYLMDRLTSVKAVGRAFTAPFFNEFTVRLGSLDVEDALKRLLRKGIIAGLSLKRFYPELKRHLLVTATEVNTKEEIDRFALELSRL
ncbi:MAG: aminomethyl-transferring glycine dehydrogenase subunit GcvPA [Deltaproteobacteria bacterium]|nr:aminomethyl-transferring glycine dehydrogenase subunit GcvPA [Deltaproteobacteria bacterium]